MIGHLGEKLNIFRSLIVFAEKLCVDILDGQGQKWA